MKQTHLLFGYVVAVLNISSCSAKFCSASILERNCKGDLQEFLALINSILKNNELGYTASAFISTVERGKAMIQGVRVKPVRVKLPSG